MAKNYRALYEASQAALKREKRLSAAKDAKIAALREVTFAKNVKTPAARLVLLGNMFWRWDELDRGQGEPGQPYQRSGKKLAAALEIDRDTANDHLRNLYDRPGWGYQTRQINGKRGHKITLTQLCDPADSPADLAAAAASLKWEKPPKKRKTWGDAASAVKERQETYRYSVLTGLDRAGRAVYRDRTTPVQIDLRHVDINKERAETAYAAIFAMHQTIPRDSVPIIPGPDGRQPVAPVESAPPAPKARGVPGIDWENDPPF